MLSLNTTLLVVTEYYSKWGLQLGSLLFPTNEFQSTGVWDTCMINLDFENHDYNTYMYLNR